MDKNLFGFLKSRKIFTHGGKRTLAEALTDIEVKSENRNRAEHPRKKNKNK